MHRHPHHRFLHPISRVGRHIEFARKSKILRIVGRKLHLDTLCPLHIGGVGQKVAVKTNGIGRGKRRDELILQQSHVVLVEVHLGEGIFEHGVDRVARVDEFVDAVRALPQHDMLGGVVTLAVDLLRHGFVHRERQDEFSGFGRPLHVIFQERHPFELSFLKNTRRHVAQRKVELVVLHHRIIVVLPQVAILFGRNHLFHQFYGRIVLARILLLTPHHFGFGYS